MHRDESNAVLDAKLDAVSAALKQSTKNLKRWITYYCPFGF